MDLDNCAMIFDPSSTGVAAFAFAPDNPGTSHSSSSPAAAGVIAGIAGVAGVAGVVAGVAVAGVAAAGVAVAGVGTSIDVAHPFPLCGRYIETTSAAGAIGSG